MRTSNAIAPSEVTSAYEHVKSSIHKGKNNRFIMEGDKVGKANSIKKELKSGLSSRNAITLFEKLLVVVRSTGMGIF